MVTIPAMEASAGAPPATRPVSFLDRLRGFALSVEERITPSEVQDVLSAIVKLLEHAGIDIPEPEPAAETQTQDDLLAQNAKLQAQVDQYQANAASGVTT